MNDNQKKGYAALRASIEALIEMCTYFQVTTKGKLVSDAVFETTIKLSQAAVVLSDIAFFGGDDTSESSLH